MKRTTKMSLPKRPHLRPLRAPKVKAVVPEVAKRFRKPTLQEQTTEALSNVPRITNETVAEHRENVLKVARKYKYPLQHSKRRIVIVSTTILAVALCGFIVFTMLSLYRFQTTSLFMYRVTQIVPFPVARANGRWVSYESYLFELRRYMHYYQAQQQVDFATKSGEFQLATYKPRALQQVIDVAYVKGLATQHGVHVSETEVNDMLVTLRAQNQLGQNNEELANIASKFFGWSIGDLRRQIKQELLAQKVSAKLDTEATKRAQDVLAHVRAGGDFGALATQFSQDPATKDAGGQYSDTAITISSQEVPPVVVRALEKLKPGEVSDVIVTPTAYEIVKLLSVENGKYKAAHIQIPFKNIQEYIQPIQKSHPAKRFIHVSEPR
jgi:hypothetical protein